MIQKMLINLDYTVKKIRHELFLFASIIVANVAMLLLPVCVIAMGYTTYHYFFTYIPNPAEQTITMVMQTKADTKIKLEPEVVKTAVPDIEYFSMTNSVNRSIVVNGIINQIRISGVDKDVNEMFRIQIVKGNKLLDYFNLDDNKKYCWVGSELYAKLQEQSYIMINDEQYWIAGVMHNRETANDVYIHSTEFMKHFKEARSYSFSILAKYTNEEDISRIFLEISQAFSLQKVVSGNDWTDYQNYNQSIFDTIVIVLGVITLVVLIYGILNILTITINKLESQKQQSMIQCFLGISKKQLFLQEIIYLLFVQVVAVGIDFILLMIMKNFIASYLNVYIDLNLGVFIVIVVLSMLLCILFSLILFKKQLNIINN